jgi:L-iditol 2-dehydrogenase
MKAAVLEGQGIIAWRDVPSPEPAPGEVVLSVRASAICGSDIHRFVRGHRTYPMILGHEAAGIVTAAGPGVSRDIVGRRAALVPLVPCHACDECQAGRFSACGSYTFIGSRRAGAFAEFVTLPLANAFAVPDEVPFEAAALIEPATVARHLLDLGGFAAGRSAIVLGAGSIGLMAVQWLRILGASLVIATDVVDANLEAARALGADVTLNPSRDDVPAEVRQQTRVGVDLALEASGSPAALAQTIDVTRPRGAVVLGGNQPPDGSLPLAFIEGLMRRELSLSGGFMSYSAPWPGHEWTESLRAVLDGGLDMAAMTSHRLPMSQAPTVFDDIASHRMTHRKVVFDPQS